MEEGGGLIVLDGTQLRDLDPDFDDGAAATVTGTRILELTDAAVAGALFGLSLPQSVRSAALARVEGLDAEGEFEAEEARRKAAEYVAAVADHLRDEPLVVSILDGSALNLFLDDEDDFAMLAENLFTDLDVDDTGKVKKKEIRNALVHMGTDMGVPPFSVSSDLLNNILKKHGAEGEEELGQAQFAQLLQPVLQELADALATNHVTVIQNFKILNGSKMRKVLTNSELFNDLIDKMYENWHASKVGQGNRERLKDILEAMGPQLGIPPSDSNEAIVLLYDQIFLSIDKEKIDNELHKDSFLYVVEYVLKKFAEQLEATPIFVGPES